MKLNNLKPAAGSTHSRRRIGRGPGSGLGGTSTRGHKGAKARSGYKKKVGFEGGQMPLQRRVPKSGFKNINHKEYFAVNLSTLQELAEAKNLTKIGIAELKEAGITNGTLLVLKIRPRSSVSQLAGSMDAAGPFRGCPDSPPGDGD